MRGPLRLLIPFISALLSSLLLSSGAEAQSWYLVWSDEFNRDGAPDPSRWSFDVDGNDWDWGNDELQNYTPETQRNAWVENGNLVIEARREPYTWPGDEQERDYTSARLRTVHQGDWLYGRVVVRAKLPTGRGVWPAIWMLPTNWQYGDWPASGELDIMKNVGFAPERVHCSVLTESFNHGLDSAQEGFVTVSSPSPSEDFHLYRMDWRPDEIEFYVDDILVYRFQNDGNDDYQTWPFNREFHLLLNVAIGGSWGGEQGVDESIFPQRMLVDYVRVYKETLGDGPWRLSMDPSANGSILLSPSQAEYSTGTEVTILAEPDDGWMFMGWTGDIVGAENPARLSMNGNRSIGAVFMELHEHVSNGDFARRLTDWMFIENGDLASRPSTRDGAFSLSSTALGANAWDLQLLQPNVYLYVGAELVLSFDASSAAGRAITVGIGQNWGDYSPYLSETIVLSVEPQTYRFPFTMEYATDDNARIYFELGADLGDVQIDNVSLVQLPVSPDFPQHSAEQLVE